VKASRIGLLSIAIALIAGHAHAQSGRPGRDRRVVARSAAPEPWPNIGGVRRASGGVSMDVAVSAGSGVDSPEYTVCAWVATVGDGIDFEGIAWRQAGGGVGQEPFFLLVDPVEGCDPEGDFPGEFQTYTLGVGQQGHGVYAECDSYEITGEPTFVCGRFEQTLTGTAGAASVLVNGVDRTVRYLSTGRAVPATPGNEIPATIAPITTPLRVANIRNNGNANMDTLIFYDCPLSDADVRRAYCSTGGSGATCTGVTPSASAAVFAHECFVDAWLFDDPGSLGDSYSGTRDLTDGGNGEAAAAVP
jgi:hypothetical protein